MMAPHTASTNSLTSVADAPRQSQSLGTFLASRLADLGVGHIFSVPGDFSVRVPIERTSGNQEILPDILPHQEILLMVELSRVGRCLEDDSMHHGSASVSCLLVPGIPWTRELARCGMASLHDDMRT